MRDIGFVEVVFYALSGFVLLIACETTENRGAESAPDSGGEEAHGKLVPA